MSYQHFAATRDLRGRPAEYLLLELLHSRSIPAELNPAEEDDYEGRAAYDILVAGEPWEVKIDWLSWSTGNICVEAPTLEHTKAHRLVLFLPNPSGFYIHTLTIQEAIDLYNAKTPTNAGYSPWKYTHKLVGDQGIPAVLLPKDITKTAGLALWQVCKIINQQHAA